MSNLKVIGVEVVLAYHYRSDSAKVLTGERHGVSVPVGLRPGTPAR